MSIYTQICWLKLNEIVSLIESGKFNSKGSVLDLQTVEKKTGTKNF